MRRSWHPPTRPSAGFSSAEAREKEWCQIAADAIIPLLPPRVAYELAGEGEAQVSREDRLHQVRPALIERAGAKGDILIEIAKMLVFLRAYAEAKGEGFGLWPMTPALAALLIRSEHARATCDAIGSRGGVTVAHGFRSTLISMAENFSFQIDYDRPVVWGAAPAAKSGGGRKTVAACAPLKMSGHTMRLARSAEPSPARYYARSLVFAEISGARVQDAERIVLKADDQDPKGIMRGWLYKTKNDGEPIDLFAYTRDYLGPIEWWEDHLRQSQTLKQIAFPRWLGPRGCIKDIFKGTGLAPEVATPDHIRQATYAIWAKEPLGLTESLRKEANLAGHTLHASASDAAGFIGLYPQVACDLPEDLKRGFVSDEQRIIGNWLRCRSQGNQDPTREGAAPAVPAGAPAERDDSQHYYSRGKGRKADREQQLRARSRLCRFVECSLRFFGIDRPFSEWPKNDWEIVIRPGDSA